MCDNHSDSVGSSKKGPSHTGLGSGLQVFADKRENLQATVAIC